MSRVNPFGRHLWGPDAPKMALSRVAELCRTALNLDVRSSADGLSFRSVDDRQAVRRGVAAVDGKVVDDTVISVTAVLLRTDKKVSVSLEDLLGAIAGCHERVRPLPPVRGASGEVSFPFEMRVQATPMDGLRERGFITEMKRLDELARTLQELLPAYREDRDLLRTYSEFSAVLEPIMPLCGDMTERLGDLRTWAQKTLGFLRGSLCVAVASSFPIEGEAALSVLAGEAGTTGLTLARVAVPGLTVNSLSDLARRAPGIIAVPAVCLSLGANPYELGREIHALLRSLSAARRPSLFTGKLSELQGLFHGGQGGEHNPRFPVVSHVPHGGLDLLSQFAVRSSGRDAGGLTQREEAEVARCVTEGLSAETPHTQRELLPSVAAYAVGESKAGVKLSPSRVSEHAALLRKATETLSGLGSSRVMERSPEVQESFEEVLGDPEALLSYFREHLAGQDDALAELTQRLASEVAGDLHMPICYLAEGSPGTGKSEAARLLAKRLGIPHENVDCAGIPDHHTAAYQLFGSPPGYVDSHQLGRLERIAKHHTGVVLEVSDLDHADPRAREHLAGLFLDVLGSGLAQNQKGYRFSCSSVIFAFTMNLPDCMDEGVRKAVGFRNAPSRQDVRQRVIREIARIFSPAFISRVGNPVIFEPLDDETLAEIAERSVRKAILSLAARRHMGVIDVVVAQGLGRSLMPPRDANTLSFGAREIIRRVRRAAAAAFRNMLARGLVAGGSTLFVSAKGDGTLTIDSFGQGGMHG